MKLFIDESGNTGPTKIKNLVSNFADQPYYTLAGILINNKQENQLSSILENLVQEFRIQASELKAKRLYEKNPNFIIELTEYISRNQIPCFIEIMEKKYYMDTQILEAFIIPSHLMTISNELIMHKQAIASNLSEYLSNEIYENFCNTCQNYTAEGFENFIRFIKFKLSKHPINDAKRFLLNMVKMTETHYLELKTKIPTGAFKSFLPIPDRKHNDKYLFMLPNYHAFSNLIGRVNLYIKKNKLGNFTIIHDDQKQFDIIYKDIIQHFKTSKLNSNEMIKNTIIEQKVDFNFNHNFSLHFEKSENLIALQCADLLAGFIMRYLKDFENKKTQKIKKYKQSISQLINVPMPEGINFVITDQDFSKFMDYLKK